MRNDSTVFVALDVHQKSIVAAFALLYGSGLRLMECLRLRVKDVDFDRKILVVREGKGRKTAS